MFICDEVRTLLHFCNKGVPQKIPDSRLFVSYQDAPWLTWKKNEGGQKIEDLPTKQSEIYRAQQVIIAYTCCCFLWHPVVHKIRCEWNLQKRIEKKKSASVSHWEGKLSQSTLGSKPHAHVSGFLLMQKTVVITLSETLCTYVKETMPVLATWQVAICKTNRRSTLRKDLRKYSKQTGTPSSRYLFPVFEGQHSIIPCKIRKDPKVPEI